MGLDNGIVVVNTSDKKNPILKTLYKKCDKIDDNSYDVCYWRGCWNIRNKIFSLFVDSLPLPQSQIYLSIENVNEIIKFLKSLNKENWNDYGTSIWDWTEDSYKKEIRKNIKNLSLLKKAMKSCDNLEVYFYDSY